jgi:hypothetical protein
VARGARPLHGGPLFDFNQGGISKARAQLDAALRRYAAVRDAVAAEVREARETLAAERRRAALFDREICPAPGRPAPRRSGPSSWARSRSWSSSRSPGGWPRPSATAPRPPSGCAGPRSSWRGASGAAPAGPEPVETPQERPTETESNDHEVEPDPHRHRPLAALAAGCGEGEEEEEFKVTRAATEIEGGVPVLVLTESMEAGLGLRVEPAERRR